MGWPLVRLKPATVSACEITSCIDDEQSKAKTHFLWISVANAPPETVIIAHLRERLSDSKASLQAITQACIPFFYLPSLLRGLIFRDSVTLVSECGELCSFFGVNWESKQAKASLPLISQPDSRLSFNISLRVCIKSARNS